MATTETTPDPTPVVEATVPSEPEVQRTWVADDIRNGMTLKERVVWDNDLAPEIKTAKIEMSAPQLVEHTVEVLALLEDAGLISDMSVIRVLAPPAA